jgi:hypothetical protein
MTSGVAMLQRAPGGPWLVDQRPRWRRLLGPMATIVGILAAVGYVRTVDPNVPGHYPGCPTQTLLGIDCAGCGGLRATHEFAHGNIGAALDHNILVVLAVPLVVVVLAVWWRRAWRGVVSDPAQYSARRARLERIIPLAVVAVLLGFSVIRNLVPYLGSGIG